MKKFKCLLFLIIAFSFPMALYGCTPPGMTVTANFTQTKYELELGQEYDPFDFVEEAFDTETKKGVSFVSSDKTIVFVTPQQTLVTCEVGSVTLFAYFNDQQLGYTVVEVTKEKQTLAPPVNVQFDINTGDLTWDKVYYQSHEMINFAYSYTVEITKNGGAPLSFVTSSNVFGVSTGFEFDNGAYKVRVKTNGNDVINGSDYPVLPNGDLYYYEFSVMASPTNLSYNQSTHTLSWIDERNPLETRYKVFVDDQLVTTESGTTSKSLLLDTLAPGVHTMRVIALPVVNTIFPASSETLSVEFLPAATLNVNNGLLIWTASGSVKNYELYITNGYETVVHETLSAQTSSYDVSGFESGQYYAKILVVGERANNVYNSVLSNEVRFKKLPKASVTFDINDKIFSVTNNGAYSYKIILEADGSAPQTYTSSFVFDKTDYRKYNISAQLLAGNTQNEISGEITTEFTLVGGSGALSYVQNLSPVALSYNETDGAASINFTEIDSGASYELYCNAQPSGLTFNNGFALGSVTDLFVNSDKVSYKILITKLVTDKTVFLNNSSEMAVQKIASPEAVKVLNDGKVEVINAGTLSAGIDSISYEVNGALGQYIDYELDENIIKVKYNRTTASSLISGVKTYFASSSEKTFTINRLSPAQNLAYDYTTGTFSFDEVENAIRYDIYKDGELIAGVTTTSYVHNVSGNYTLSVVAIADEITNLTASEIGYTNSSAASLNILELNNASELKLANENDVITANWIAPNNITLPTEAVVEYDVYVNNTLVTTTVNTNFTFEASAFNGVGNYNIKVVTKSQNSDFYVSVPNNLEVSVTKLPKLETLTKTGTIITANAFDALATVEITGTTSSTQFDTETLAAGETIILLAKYKGVFDSDSSIYYLENEATTFTVTKISQPINLDYENGVISWEAQGLDAPNLTGYEYYTTFNSDIVKTTLTSQEFDQDEAFTFYVKECLDDWTVINSNESKKVESGEFASIEVKKENAVTDFRFEFTTEDVVLFSWEYEPLADMPESYAPAFTVVMYNSDGFYGQLNGPVAAFAGDNGRYAYSLAKSYFMVADTYKFSVIVRSADSISAQNEFTNLTKLAASDYMGIIDQTVYCLDSSYNIMQTADYYEVMINGVANGTEIDLSQLNEGEMRDIEVYFKAKAHSSVTDGNYYLDSEKTVFKIQKLTSVVPSVNAQQHSISFTARDNAADYTLLVEQAGLEPIIIDDQTATNYDLSSPPFSSIITEAGVYTLKVKANVAIQVILPFDSADLTTIGYISSEYGASCEIIKLETVENLLIETEDSDWTQENVTLSFDNVPNAENYDIYVSASEWENAVVYKNVVAMSGDRTSLTTNAFSETGTYTVAVVAKAKGKISSAFSEKIQLIRLEKVTHAYLTCFNETHDVSWSVTNEANYYGLSYYVEICDMAGQMQTTYGDETLTSNLLSIANDSYIESLNGENFLVKVYVKGSGSLNDGVATLTSEYFEFEAYKFLSPTISIKDGKVVIESADTINATQLLNFVYTIYYEEAGEKVYFANGTIYTGPIEVLSQWETDKFIVEAYATAASSSEQFRNYAKSNTSSAEFERLPVVGGLTASLIDDLDVTQSGVKIEWNTVADADFYKIYINDREVDTVLTNASSVIEYASNTLFERAGTYNIYVVAYADDKICSHNSDEIKVVRLNPIQTAFMDKEQTVYWTEPIQGYAEEYYSYYIEILSPTGRVEHAYGIDNRLTGTSYKAENFEMINRLDGQTFYVNLATKGSGEISNGILTLTSSFYEFDVYKLISPQIDINSNVINITSADAYDREGQFSIFFTVKCNGETLIDNQLYTSGFAIHENWLGGVYEVTAYALPLSTTTNLITSNSTTKSFERLSAPTNVIVETSDDEPDQLAVDIKWDKVPGATNYDIYINNAYSDNIICEDEVIVYQTFEHFADTGMYIVKIVAKADGKLSSVFSNTVKVIRLESLNTLYMDKNAVVHYANIKQYSDDYYYQLIMCTYESSMVNIKAQTAISDLSLNTYSEFAGNTWLTNLSGGQFAINIRLVGNGSSENAENTATLSSAVLETQVFKLYSPVIQINNSDLVVYTEDADSALPSGEILGDAINHYYTINHSGVFAKDEYSYPINDVLYTSPFSYPNAWEAGLYEINARSTAKDGYNNIIDGKPSVATTTRLSAPTELEFYRGVLTDEEKQLYTNDGNLTADDYVSDKIYFTFNPIPHAIGYKIFNETAEEVTLANTKLVEGGFDNLLNSGSGIRTLAVMSVASGGEYINSASLTDTNTIKYTKLNIVSGFASQNGKAKWSGVMNASSYLVKATNPDFATYTYWQSETGTTVGSSFKGILDNIAEGQINFTIKAIGNVTPDGTSTQTAPIYLDGTYCEDTSFIKLAAPTDMSTYLGFFSIANVQNANRYKAYVYLEDRLITEFILEKYNDILRLNDEMNELYFVGYANVLHNLLYINSNNMYQVRFESQSDNTNTIYSDLSTPINFKVLQNANSVSDIKLKLNPNGDLTKTLITAYAQKGSYGLLSYENGIIKPFIKQTTPYEERTLLSPQVVVTNGDKNTNYTFASIGSSSVEVDENGTEFYYICSQFVTSLDFYIVGSPSIRLENGTLRWNAVEGADGYYVYIKANAEEPALYGNGIYTLNYLEVPDTYGGVEASEIEVSVVAVVTSTESIYGPTAKYRYGNSNKIIKLKKPQQVTVKDGALTWDSLDSMTVKNNYFTHIVLSFENVETGEVYPIQINPMQLLPRSLAGFNGLPRLDVLFEDISIITAGMPAGNYTLTIKQLGNNSDWLTSTNSDTQNIYIPEAPQNLEIINDGGDFYLCWDEASVPGVNYAPTSGKYILYGQNAGGSRYEICRMDGDATNIANRLSISLTDLINAGKIPTYITKLFIGLAGDDGQVIRGLKSQIFEITVLEKLTAFMDEGFLAWNGEPSAFGYEIKLVAEGHSAVEVELNETKWIGDELAAGVIYNTSIRPLGNIYSQSGTTTYVLSGQTINFKLGKLTPLDVAATEYGLFEWALVDNAEGFRFVLDGTEDEVIVKDALANTYETEYYGYYNYLFRALGTTSAINVNLDKVYYLNSHINNETKGILGATLPKVQEVWVEDGIIKWTPITNDRTTEYDGMIKVIGYRLSFDDAVDPIFTTIDTAGFGMTDSYAYFDFTEYGHTRDYNVTVKAYVYYQNAEGNNLLKAVINHAEDNKNYEDYSVILGEGATCEFTKISAPTNVRIENGVLTWDAQENCSYYVTIYSDGGIILEDKKVMDNFWWTDDARIIAGANYYAKVKAFREITAEGEKKAVYSVNTTYATTLNGGATAIRKLTPLDTAFDTYTDQNNGNFISFTYIEPSYDVGFNIRYKTSLNSEWKYVYCDKENEGKDANYYNNVVSYINNIVTISVMAIDSALSDIYYEIQVVPLGVTNLWKSDYSATTYLSTPKPLSGVYYDTYSEEYYWKYTPNTYGFVVKDEIISSEGEVIATYYYKISNADLTNKPYYKEREVDGGIAGTLSYQPSITGLHKVSVAVCLDPNATQSLMSPYAEGNAQEINLFATQTNFYAYFNSIYHKETKSDMTSTAISSALGGTNNPFIISGNSAFANINKRLNKFDYMNNYQLEFTKDAQTVILNITDASNVFTFKLTQNLTGVTTSIGLSTLTAGGNVMYSGWANVLDGNGYQIAYSVKPSDINGDRLGLVTTLEKSGVVKNLKVYATVDFETVLNGAFVYGGIVAYNNGGTVSNVVVTNIVISNLVAENGTGISGLTFGGVVGENAGGYIEYAALNSMQVAIGLSSNGGAIYAGGIAGRNSAGKIYYSANKANFDITGKAYSYFGGITGYSTGEINSSFNEGTFTMRLTSNNGVAYLGGLAGVNHNGSVMNSYNSASTFTTLASAQNCNAYLGGLIGQSNNVNIKNNFSLLSSTYAANSGTLIGNLTTSIPVASADMKFNYFTNETAIGNYSGELSNLAKLITITNLTAELLGEDIFDVGAHHPKFIWESDNNLLMNQL